AAASPVFVAEDGDLIGILACSDPVRPEAPAVIRALRNRGIRDIIMLTGDHPAVAKTAADRLGITRYVADAFPEQKSDFVRSLQQRGATVAVVGDGINDSPALALADVGIAVRGGTDVARETAHIAILEGNLWKIPQAIDIARQAIGLVEQLCKLSLDEGRHTGRALHIGDLNAKSPVEHVEECRSFHQGSLSHRSASR